MAAASSPTTVLTQEDEELLAGSGFQWLVAALAETREVSFDADPLLHRDGDTESDLELRLSCF
jgi:hypothetical protein